MDRHVEGIGMINNSLQNMGVRLHVLENRVPVEQQLEYLFFSHKLKRSARKKVQKMNEEELEKFFEQLSSAELPMVEKKKILSLTASSSEIRAFRLLENYMKQPDEELANWASMALMECQMALESDLSGERQIYISTGLGGKGEKLRFYVLLFSSEGAPFESYQREVIEKEFGYYLSKNDCEIERLSIFDNYVEFVFLMPFLSDMYKILEQALAECNVYGSFLSERISVTNVRELNKEEINEILTHRLGN